MRINAAEDPCGMEFCERNINVAVEHFSPRIVRHLEDVNNRGAVIAFMPIKNKTSLHIDVGLLRSMLITSLVRNKVQVLDDARVPDHVRETEKGLNDLSKETYPGTGMHKGPAPTLVLTGDIRGDEQAGGAQRKLYLNLTLRLLEPKTGAIAWSDQMEYLKVAERRELAP